MTSGVAAPFANGSFEDPGISSVTVVTYPGNTTLGAWLVTGYIDYGNTGVVYQGQTFFASDGQHAIDLTGPNLSRAGSVAQTFDVLPRTRYVLTFDIGRFSSKLLETPGTSTVQVRLDGADLGTFVNDLVSSNYTWQTRSLEFVTGAAQTSANLQSTRADLNALVARMRARYAQTQPLPLAA
jgi:hypothetical protein